MKNGDRIRITWLPPCKNVTRNTPNPYIGMEGIVVDLNKEEGYFHLFTGQSWLCGIKTGFYHSRYKIIK